MTNTIRHVSKNNSHPLVEFHQTGEVDRSPNEVVTLLKRLLQETRGHVSFAQKMFAKAREEDWGPGGWDSDDFSDIIFESLSALATLPANTEEEIKTGLEIAQEMILESAATYTGARACVALGECREVVEEGTEKICSQFSRGDMNNVEVGAQLLFYYGDKLVRVEGNLCRPRPPCVDMHIPDLPRHFGSGNYTTVSMAKHEVSRGCSD